MSFIALVMTCCVAAWPGSGLGVLAGWRCGHLQEFGDFEVHDGPKIGLAIGFWLQEEVGVRVLSWCDSISILCIFWRNAGDVRKAGVSFRVGVWKINKKTKFM